MPIVGEWNQPDDVWLNQNGSRYGRRTGSLAFSDEDQFVANVETPGGWGSTPSTSGLSSFIAVATLPTPPFDSLWVTAFAAGYGVAQADGATYPKFGPLSIPDGATVEYEDTAGDYLGSWRASLSVSSGGGPGSPTPHGSAYGAIVLDADPDDGFPGVDGLTPDLIAGVGDTDNAVVSLAAGQWVGIFALTSGQYAKVPPSLDTSAHATHAENAVLGIAVQGLYRPPRWRYVWPTSGQWELRQRQNASGNAGGWPLRHRQTGNASGAWPLRHRQ